MRRAAAGEAADELVADVDGADDAVSALSLSDLMKLTSPRCSLPSHRALHQRRRHLPVRCHITVLFSAARSCIWTLEREYSTGNHCVQIFLHFVLAGLSVVFGATSLCKDSNFEVPATADVWSGREVESPKSNGCARFAG
jgi:hypothetical protein